MAWEPTTTQILDMDGVRARGDRFRFDLYRGDELAGQLTPDLERAPVVRWSGTSTIMRSLQSLHLPASETGEVNTMTDKIAPVMVLQNGAEERLGTFVFSDDQEPERPWGPERESSLDDETADLDQGASWAHSWDPNRVGIMVVAAARRVAEEVYPTSQIVTGPGDGILGEPLNYPIGASRIRMITDLLAVVGYLPPHMDRNSQLQLVDVPDVDTAVPVSSYEDGTRIVAGTLLYWNEKLKAPNRYTVTSTGSQGSKWIGRYDVPDDAPHSIANRNGRVITYDEVINGLSSQAQADKAARNLARVNGPGYRFATFKAPADWRHDAFSVVRLRGENWLEVGWDLTCRPGALMTHTLRRPY